MSTPNSAPLTARRVRNGSLLLLGALTLSGCSSDQADSRPVADESFVAGCEPYVVYSQNRFEPYGTAVRTEPVVTAPKSDKTVFAPNEVIAVDGWTRYGEVVYPTNPLPIRTNIWFHLANSDEYVSFAGVRGAPTANDETGGLSSDLGPLAELKPECEYQIDK